LGKIYEKKGDFALALSKYQTIIENTAMDLHR
jgi:hypothetical protein